MVVTIGENSSMTPRFPVFGTGQVRCHQWDGECRTGRTALRGAQFHVVLGVSGDLGTSGAHPTGNWIDPTI